MKSTQTTLIKKIVKSCLFKVLLIDIILLMLFRYYQPLCEPCIEGADCPPCLSKLQYFIIYFGIVINVIGCIYCMIKWRKK